MMEKNVEVKELLSSSMLANAKLAQAVSIMMRCHLSSKEKETIAKRIDACSNTEELEGTMTLINGEMKKGFMDESTGELWSPQFVNDIQIYYSSGFPFNPIERISELFSTIKEFIIAQETLNKLEDGDQKNEFLEGFAIMKNDCKVAIVELDGIIGKMRDGFDMEEVEN